MVGGVYDKKFYLLQNSITARGLYRVCPRFESTLSMPFDRWQTKSKSGKALCMQRMIQGPYPIKTRNDGEDIYWGGGRNVAIAKAAVVKSKKKPNQKTNKKKTITNKRKPTNEQDNSTSSSCPSLTPPPMKKAKKKKGK